MSAGHAVFAECDDCGCLIAPSDRPVRALGSATGLRRPYPGAEYDEWIPTVEIHCPSCLTVVQADLPDGVYASDVFGPVRPYGEFVDVDEAGGSD